MVTLAERREALRAGQWLSQDGTQQPLRRLHDCHVVNALLRELEHGSPRGITEPLAREVAARGLREAAFAEVERRYENRTHR